MSFPDGDGFPPPAARYAAILPSTAPLDDPRFVILVTADEPRYGTHGSDVAAPVARSVAITALRDADLLPAAIELEVDTALAGDG